MMVKDVFSSRFTAKMQEDITTVAITRRVAYDGNRVSIQEERALLKSIITLLSIFWWPFLAHAEESSIYDYSFTTIDGRPMPLSDFKGRAILIINTASLCSFTQQYPLIQEVWERYKNRGLVVIGVPCNDFGNQEPEDEDQIQKFCSERRVTFLMTSKVSSKGEKQHPFFAWVAKAYGPAATPKWNFTKYLIDSNGKAAEWFLPTTLPNAPRLLKAIEASLPPRYEYKPDNLLPNGTQPSTLPPLIRP
jgi:glutathione peroxidase